MPRLVPVEVAPHVVLKLPVEEAMRIQEEREGRRRGIEPRPARAASPRVQIVCQNWKEDRIIPRMARALSSALGWSLGSEIDPSADVIYLSGYFQATRLRAWPAVPVAAYFTHREEEPPGNAKAALFDRVAARVQLRVVTCRLYGDQLAGYGPTAVCAAPLERERFSIVPRERGRRPVVGLSGFTYPNQRKGQDLIATVLDSDVGRRVEWVASGRGWPVKTQRRTWDEMPAFYQGLDVLVIPSRVEGIPMPPLEALACGVSVVIPRGVGLLDELPDLAGIHRYERGDAEDLARALEEAVDARGQVQPEALREATAPYSVDAWVSDHARAFAEHLGVRTPEPSGPVPHARPVYSGESRRGIYCVAFGEPARASARRMMESAKRYMPEVPICLAAASPIGPEDLFVDQPDSDVGGRRAKLRAYELSPDRWQSVLYLDVDTEVASGDVRRYFDWIEDGWEFVICKDPHLMDSVADFARRNNRAEMRELLQTIKTSQALGINGGVWAFGRSERIAGFFRRWQTEWEKHAQRDQGALLRALYADPLRVMWLGNEWNTFPKYEKGIATAGLYHYPGRARRWKGQLPGRIDSPEAWAVVRAQGAAR